MPTPRFLSTVLSVKSRCHRLMGSLFDKCCITAFAIPRLPSEFSKSIGLTCTKVEPHVKQHLYVSSSQVHSEFSRSSCLTCTKVKPHVLHDFNGLSFLKLLHAVGADKPDAVSNVRAGASDAVAQHGETYSDSYWHPLNVFDCFTTLRQNGSCDERPRSDKQPEHVDVEREHRMAACRLGNFSSDFADRVCKQLTSAITVRAGHASWLLDGQVYSCACGLCCKTCDLRQAPSDWCLMFDPFSQA